MSEPLHGGDLSDATPESPNMIVEQPAEGSESVSHMDKGKGRAQDSPEMEEDSGLGDGANEETRLKFLTTVRDQDDLERDIGRQADQLLTEQADERDNKRMHKTLADKQRCVSQLKKLEEKLAGPGGSSIKNKVREDIADMKARIDGLNEEAQQIEDRIAERHRSGGADTLLEVAGNRQQPGESRRDFLIRTGKITPFSRMAQLPNTSSNLGDIMLEAEAEDEVDEEEGLGQAADAEGPISHRNLLKPGFKNDISEASSTASLSEERPAKRRKLKSRREVESTPEISSPAAGESDDAFVPDMDDRKLAALGETDEEEGDDAEDDDYDMTTPGRKRKAKAKPTKAKKDSEEGDDEGDLTGLDDGNETVYQARLQKWIRLRSEARRKASARSTQAANVSDATEAIDEDSGEEWHQPHPTRPDAIIDGGLKIPGDIYPSLFDYQKTGVQWLWELYSQQVGGIIGDEMGLGKTIQAISFIAGLHYSKKLTKPVIVVCPATVMKQWVNEFHQWWPALRVSILHTSGSGMMDIRQESQMEKDLESRSYRDPKKKLTNSEKAAKKIVDRVKIDGHVLVTTYSGLQTYAQLLIPTEWEYAVLDEGHKIRNPNAGITIYCKELRTANRLILSGTPMQNNLAELWSLFDFVYPMRLGTLVNFRNHFEFPIRTGGYANASNLQVETAMRCAETLKETISGYLLQRFKVDVAADLPKKTERVLFCRLTKVQLTAYEDFLKSGEMQSIYDGKRQALFGIDILRKICNHPDLVHHKTLSYKSDYKYGSGSKSGKMQVVKELLQMWTRKGHKTLLFAQHRIMLDILEKFVKNMDGINYMRMDGTTNIKDRQSFVDRFNNDPNVHVFLLTTKVGGLGTNLTGADRVIIYDPDWNPSTDVQARERAWRLGQKREVEIYRLMTAGTIEEKIYHRQIFKQFLTNKILRDPKQRQTFHLKDLHDLFTLSPPGEGETETGSLFKGTETRISDSPPANGAQALKPDEDLKEIYGIRYGEDWRGAEDDAGPSTSRSNGDDEQGSGSAKDDRILSTIFARSGVQSSLNHDSIIGGNSQKPKFRADPEIIAREARRVADLAAKELQRFGEQARHVPIGVPTWTGEVGEAGRPKSPPRRNRGSSRGGFGAAGRGGRGGLASSTVLSNLSARQGLDITANGGRSGIGSSSSSRAGTPSERPEKKLKGRDFLSAIRDFIVAHDGAVYTQMLIDHFSRHTEGDPQRGVEFREMLRRIAVLEKPGGLRGGTASGRGKWVLKEEFRKR